MPPKTWRLTTVLDFFDSRSGPKAGRYFACPDLCQYGMQEPPGDKEIYWKKRITLAATYAEIQIL